MIPALDRRGGSCEEALRLESGRWTIVGTWSGSATVRAEPFEALEIDLPLPWEEPPAER